MYGKHFASMYTGSMFGAGVEVFAVWGYVIAHTVQSQVELNPKVLAAMLGTVPEKVERAIAFLCAADPSSRTKEADGRRLIKEGEFAYHVPTHELYRSLLNEDTRREYNRRKQAEHRAKQKEPRGVNGAVIDSQTTSALSAHTEAEVEAETEARSKNKRRHAPTPVLDASLGASAAAGGTVDALVPDTVTVEFERAWARYPKRAGGDGKPDARKAFTARLQDTPPDVILAGVERYRAYCEAAGDIGTQFVMRAARFFGPGRHWAEAWDAPPERMHSVRTNGRIAESRAAVVAGFEKHEAAAEGDD